MKTVQDYLRHADECEALSQRAVTPDERKTLRDMAETWRMLAKQRAQARAAAKDDES